MELINFKLAWIWILAGFLAGAIQGSFFHNDNWKGGYGSWDRRIMRLGHISFFGLGFINLLYVFSVELLDQRFTVGYESYLFLIGMISMPLICYLSAVKKYFRHLFFIPVISLIVAVLIFIYKVIEV